MSDRTFAGMALRESRKEYAEALRMAAACLPVDPFLGLGLAAAHALRDFAPLLSEPRFVRMLENEFGACRDDWYDECAQPERYRRMVAALSAASAWHRFRGGKHYGSN